MDLSLEHKRVQNLLAQYRPDSSKAIAIAEKLALLSNDVFMDEVITILPEVVLLELKRFLGSLSEKSFRHNYFFITSFSSDQERLVYEDLFAKSMEVLYNKVLQHPSCRS